MAPEEKIAKMWVCTNQRLNGKTKINSKQCNLRGVYEVSLFIKVGLHVKFKVLFTQRLEGLREERGHWNPEERIFGQVA